MKYKTITRILCRYTVCVRGIRGKGREREEKRMRKRDRRGGGGERGRRKG